MLLLRSRIVFLGAVFGLASCAPQAVERGADVETIDAHAPTPDGSTAHDAAVSPDAAPVDTAGPSDQPDAPVGSDVEIDPPPPPPDAAVAPDVAVEVPPPPLDAAPDLAPVKRMALLVVKSTKSPSDGDKRLQMLLEAHNFTVKLSGDSGAVGDADGTALVVVASTVTADTVAKRFRTLAEPVVVLESAIFDDMGMTGGTSGTDFQEATGNTLTITGTGPLTAGLTGTVTLSSSSSTTMNWGKPAASAIKVATFGTAADKIAIFAYDKTVMMMGVAAPARRVGLFAADSTAAVLSADGIKLFDAALDWALQ